MLDVRSPLTAHLAAYVDLTGPERELIQAAASKTIRSVGPHQDIVREGDEPRTVKVVLEGWVARYKQLPDGRRQILALMIPGDICDANAFIRTQMDHSLCSLTQVRYAEISQADFEALMTSSPRIIKALWWSELVTVSIQREWTTNLGQRMAYERIAHLFCEVFTRLQTMGLTDGESCEFPLTQGDIADATGLTPVHVNRMIQALRHDGLIELRDKRLQLRDPARLREAAMFNPSYLHL